jgi:hypothetical protein
VGTGRERVDRCATAQHRLLRELLTAASRADHVSFELLGTRVRVGTNLREFVARVGDLSKCRC